LEINWSTFVLEIINFLVLVWILKRYLYKPVLDMIARRRAAVEKILHDAETAEREAETLRKHYEERQADWAQERQLARDKLMQEIDEARTQQMAKLRSALQEEQDKTRAAETSRQASFARATEATSLTYAARFAARLLEQVSSPELEARLLELTMIELSQLPDARTASLRDSWARKPEFILIASAYAIAEKQRKKLDEILSALVEARVPMRYEQDADILCGVRISIGAWVLSANIRDELTGFAELAQGMSGGAT